MNREIKFRIMKEDKFWEYIEFPEFDEEIYMHSDMYDRKTVGQYTGLKDKNGKEVYEGDIIKFSFKTGDVIKICMWSNDYQGWLYGGFYYSPDEFEYAEIIGNIYENPDLIK